MTDVVSGTAQDADRAADASLLAAFYRAAWRWHFYAGLFVVPFFCILAVTGMMMMYIGYFDGRDGENIRVTVPQGAVAMAVSEQAEKAVAELGGGTMVEWLSPRAEDRVGVFRIRTDAGQEMVAINPYTGDVVETWGRRAGWYDLADDIHSDLLLGTPGDRMLEIAAGFGIILIITGLYMWWPREGGLGAVLLPRFNQKGRAFWKTLHGTVGFYLSAFLLLFLLSGMSWTGVWGSKLTQAWSTFPAEKWDNVPLSDMTHAEALNHDGVANVPWALEQTMMPASGSTGGVVGVAPGVAVDIDSLASLAKAVGFNARYRISYPKGETGVWTINQDTMSSDAADPFSDRTVHVDRYTGHILASVSFEDYSLAGKAMAVGIPLHMGLTGLWNLMLNTVICLSVIFLSLSSVVLWWKRRPSRGGVRLFAPQVPSNLPHWRSAMLVMLAVSLFFPLVGLTLIAVLAMDILVISRIAPLARALR